MAKIAEVQEVTTDKLRPYEHNAKKHGRDQIEKLKASIREFGFLTPCLIDREFNLIAGHGRVAAAKELGMETVPCVFIEGLTETQRRAYILADNKLGELGEWDSELVSEELKSLQENGFEIDLTGFDIDAIIFDDIEDLEEPKPPVIDPTEEPIAKRGEVWQLGDHRLMCGDSTNPEDIKILMDGEEADLLLTDPPYNVNYEGAAGKIENDDMPEHEFFDFLVKAFENAYAVMKEGASFYIWHADISGLIFRSAADSANLKVRQCLVWVKNTFNLGRQDYQCRHEPCLYGWKEGAAHYFIDMRSLSTVSGENPRVFENMTKDQAVNLLQEYLDEAGTVIKADKPMRSELHPTMKPMGMIKKQIRNSTRPKELVLDMFGGSGTTLLAAEAQGRRCNMMEYDEHFASVIIRRFEEETGKKARRIG